MATTNIAAERLAQEEPEQAKRVVGGSMTIALVFGAALAAGVRFAAVRCRIDPTGIHADGVIPIMDGAGRVPWSEAA